MMRKIAIACMVFITAVFAWQVGSMALDMMREDHNPDGPQVTSTPTPDGADV